MKQKSGPDKAPAERVLKDIRRQTRRQYSAEEKIRIAKPEIVPSLFVLNSRGATLQGDTLTLTGVMSHSIIFADRPVRAAGHQLTVDIIADWGAGEHGDPAILKGLQQSTAGSPSATRRRS
jgi:hypothetical protein